MTPEEKPHIVRVVRKKSGTSYSYMVTIPKKLAEEMGLKGGDLLKITVVDNDTIVLKRIKIE